MDDNTPNRRMIAVFWLGMVIGVVSLTLTNYLTDTYGVAHYLTQTTGILDAIAILLLITAKPGQVVKDGAKGFLLPATTWIRFMRSAYLIVLPIMLAGKFCCIIMLYL